jgi:hypothetical protein
MFQFLRSNASITFILLVGIWTIATFAFVQADISPLLWELKNYLLGQKLNEGFRMYQDIRDNSGPLTAGFFQLTDFLNFPISWNAYWATGIILFQAIIFQRTINRYELMAPLGNMPFFIYTIFLHISLDFWVPSAALLGLTFLMLAWREIIKQQSTLQVDDRVFLIGLFIGAAGLCYPTYYLFIFWGFLSLLFYSGINVRQMLLVLVGFLIVNGITALLYTYHGNFPYLIEVFEKSALVFHTPEWADIQHIASTYTPALVLGFYGLWTVIQRPKIKSNGQKAQQTNFIWVIISFFSVFTLPANNSHNYLFVLPAMAYFTLNLFFLLKRYWIQELILFAFLVSVGFTWRAELQNSTYNRVQAGKLPIKNERLMVLGPQIDEYQQNKMAGPFINWELSNDLFSTLNTYRTVVTLQRYLEQDRPTYIYDPAGNFPRMRFYLPYLQERYVEVQKHLYKLKN